MAVSASMRMVRRTPCLDTGGSSGRVAVFP